MGGVYVQFGAGADAPEGWLNFDVSPTLRLARLPLIGKLVRSPFPSSVRYGDIVRGLPVADGTVDGAYASHVLEHLFRADFDAALANTLRMLKPGGRFRMIVPDLEVRVQRYVSARAAHKTDANDQLFRELLVAPEQRPGGLIGRARALLGNSAHRWMWDYPAVEAALRSAGFVRVRRCAFGDSGDPAFDAVEREDRFIDHSLGGIQECAAEAWKP
jgi:SAM-dependent methyltransferase